MEATGGSSPRGTQRYAARWLSAGLETLYRALDLHRAQVSDDVDFDVVVIGSGYGGAVALANLAGCAQDGRPLRLCLLERGSEYLPGAFPSRFADLPRHVRFTANGNSQPRGRRSGLLDVRLGPDVNAVLANGLGGGSLINAGVLATPHPRVFDDLRWPAAIRVDAAQLLARAQALKPRLGATPYSASLAKTTFMRTLSKKANLLDVAVAPAPARNAEGVDMAACVACGDCATGCNVGAKASLDTNLLVGACLHTGVEVYTGATVLTLAQKDGIWSVTTVHTDDRLRRREEGALQVRARRVVLAAGTYGSTEILARSARAGLALSPLVGSRFSANGDALSAIYDAVVDAGAAADEGVAFERRGAGPTIVACIDERTGDPSTDVVFEDVSVPGPLRGAFEQIAVTANALYALSESDLRTHLPGDAAAVDDPNAVDPAKIRRTLLLASIGHDDANGCLVLDEDLRADDVHAGDGAMSVVWPGLRNDPRLARRQERLEQLVRDGKLGGRVLANPMWQPLPASVSSVISIPRGPLTTVHPLGGCPMGDDGSLGVVDDLGRVYEGATARRYDGLVVLDGSIVPTSLGINPALTIAALAERAIESLRDTVWKFERGTAVVRNPNLVFPRPRHSSLPTPQPPAPTRVVILEKLRGDLSLDEGPGQKKTYAVEVKLRSLPIDVQTLMCASGPRAVTIDASASEVRLYEPPAQNETIKLSEGDALFRASVSGHLRLFAHAPSTPLFRRLRGFSAWLRNRGLRDVAQFFFHSLSDPAVPDEPPPSLWERLRMAWALASRAGDRRLLEYDLVVAGDGGTKLAGALRGRKCLTYEFAANPWNQLQTVELEAFPGWQPTPGEASTLQFDLSYAERVDGLLLEIVEQQDMTRALADLGAFGLYLVRVLLHVHVWTFRKPDAPPVRAFARLPGHLPRLPAPQVTEFVVDDERRVDGSPVLARLTRYRGGGGVPVLLIHGYSASGTTFAHPAIVDGGLAGHLCGRERDVWVLDLRTSCGMPAASDEWSFERVGYSDIPLAVDHIVRATGSQKIDVVAHCMASAMLTLALFGPYEPVEGIHDAYLDLRKKLPDRIRCLVMSQIVPNLYMAQANVTRAYLMRYLQNYLPLEKYRFRAEVQQGAGESLLDRFLYSVPYPKDEFRLENPLWPPGALRPWVGVRHRMDALYGVTFKLANMDAAVLDRIDDFFGPLNVRAITQVIHFAHVMSVTDVLGKSYATYEVVADRVRFPILSLHSDENGLVHVSSADAMKRFIAACPGYDHRVEILHGMGHQDSLIGREAGRTFLTIAKFLEEQP